MVERIEDDPDDFGLDDYELTDEIPIEKIIEIDNTLNEFDAEQERLEEEAYNKFWSEEFQKYELL